MFSTGRGVIAAQGLAFVPRAAQHDVMRTVSNPGIIEEQPGADWHDLQQRVATILRESGLVPEVGRSLRLARGTVEIDVYATDPTTTPRAVYLCECKRWRNRVPQVEVQAFRTIVSAAGAHFGLFVSAAGFQAGAFEVVEHTRTFICSVGRSSRIFFGSVGVPPTGSLRCGRVATG